MNEAPTTTPPTPTTTTTTTQLLWDRRGSDDLAIPHGILERAKRIKVLAFDVDGVATDGRLFYGPDGCALHAFSARDGLGLVRARLGGIVTAAISGRSSPNVDARLSELKVPYIRQGIGDKLGELKGILDEVGATLEEVCFVGDDVNDLLVLRSVGLPVTVADAELELFSNVAMITHRRGGQGVLRELAEVLLRSQGRWTA